MEMLLASANFHLFLEKVDGLQGVVGTGDTENLLYRFVKTSDLQFKLLVAVS